MTYYELLTELYSNDLKKIIKILNKSIYAELVDKNQKDIFVVHTGFTFLNHQNTLFELLYDFETEKIIRQPKNENFNNKIPPINGLCVKGDTRFFVLRNSLIVVNNINKDNETFSLLKILNPYNYLRANDINEIEVEDYAEKTVKSITILDGGKKIMDFPLQNKFTEQIFQDGNTFRKNIKEEEYIQGHNPNNDLPTYEQWLREEYGDDAETAYWNNE